jgi:hypothetical protein
VKDILSAPLSLTPHKGSQGLSQADPNLAFYLESHFNILSAPLTLNLIVTRVSKVLYAAFPLNSVP